MERVNKNLDYLKVLGVCKKDMYKSILTNADKDLITTLCECILNCLQGTVDLSNDQKEKLRKKRNTLRILTDKKTPIKTKRKLLIQKGSGFLPLIIPAVLSAITSLLQ